MFEVQIPTSFFSEKTSEVVREVAAEVVADAPTIFGIGIETATGIALGGGGLALAAGGWKLAKRIFSKDRKGAAANTPQDFPAIPRDNSEIEQLIDLRQQEQREPLHDAFFGILFEDAYRSNPDQSVKEAFSEAQDRFNTVAPLSTQTPSSFST